MFPTRVGKVLKVSIIKKDNIGVRVFAADNIDRGVLVINSSSLCKDSIFSKSRNTKIGFSTTKI